MPAMIDMTGMKFDHFSVIELVPERSKHGQAMWLCQCECGKKFTARGRDLRSKRTISCGCRNLAMATERIRKNTVDHSNPSSIQSKKISKANTSGIRGVCPTKNGRWNAYIGYKGQHIYLGNYASKEEAAAARKKGEERYFLPVLEEIEKNRKEKKDEQ